MMFPHLEKVAGSSDLFALPTDPDHVEYVAKLSYAMRGMGLASVKAPTSPGQRAWLWQILNENLAAIQAEDDLMANSEGDPVEVALAKALGHPPASKAPITKTDVALARLRATVATKAACAEMLAAGYQP